MTMNAFRNYLEELKNAVDTNASDMHTLRIVRMALDRVSGTTTGDHGAMWDTARQSVGYVLDVAVNQGTNEDMWELRHCLENSGSDFSAQPEQETILELLGNLYVHNYQPEISDYSETPLDDIVEEWNTSIGYAAMQAVLEYVGNNFSGNDDDDDDDDDENE